VEAELQAGAKARASPPATTISASSVRGCTGDAG
jgi:hypothetical protein